MNILLTSAGRRGYIVKYFQDALGKEGKVHVANSSPLSVAMKYGDQAVVTPLIYDDEYIPFLTSYCQYHQIDAIIPLFDIDLPILSKNRSEFEKIGVTVIVSKEESIRICNDKWETFNYLKENNLNTPETFLSIASALNAVHTGRVSFPLIIKPRWGMGSISIYEASDQEELELLFKKVEKNILSTYLVYESNLNHESNVIIQEKLSGQEYGLDVINDLNGHYQNTVVKKKYAMRSGETDCAETVANPTLVQLAEQISRTLGHIGNLDIDAFYVEGVAYILEMNARFGGGYPFSHQAGVNLPKAIVLWLQNANVKHSLLEAEMGVIGYKDIQIISEKSKEVVDEV